MDCKEAILLMHDYLDGELSPDKSGSLKQHVIGCAGCKERYGKLEKTEAIISAMKKPVQAPNRLTSAAIMSKLPPPMKRAVWMKWPKRHPAVSVAAVFIIVMLGSFLTMWNVGSQLVLQGDLEQVIVKGNTVVVPEGHTVHGNLIVENGEIVVNGKIDGNLIVIDGNYALASTAQISGDVRSVNQAAEWIWYKLDRFFSMLVK